MARDTVRTLLWIAWSLCLARGQEAVEKLCGHPPVPAGATYLNVTGGLGQRDWVVRYVCDNGKSKYQTLGLSVVMNMNFILRTKQPQRQDSSHHWIVRTKRNVITHSHDSNNVGIKTLGIIHILLVCYRKNDPLIVFRYVEISLEIYQQTFQHIHILNPRLNIPPGCVCPCWRWRAEH